jgi:hypothetical protein
LAVAGASCVFARKDIDLRFQVGTEEDMMAELFGERLLVGLRTVDDWN